jgi:hypothetical protein
VRFEVSGIKFKVEVGGKFFDFRSTIDDLRSEGPRFAAERNYKCLSARKDFWGKRLKAG